MEIRTIYEITATILLALFGFILLIQFSTPVLRGVSWTSRAFATGAVGLGLLTLRGRLPDALTIILPNLLLALVNVFLYWAVQEILRTRRRVYWILPASLIPTLAFFLYFTYVHDQIVPRIIFYSILAIAGELMIAWLLLTNGERGTRTPRFSIAGLFIFWGFANFHRMSVAIRQHPSSLFQEIPHPGALILIIPVLEIMMIGLGLIWLTMAHLQLDLEELSRTDALTGLLNRRAIEAAAITEIALARQQDTPLSLVLIDLDHFKSVNDTHGHACGDVTLTTTAHCLRRNLRDYELIARFGGEEFLVFLPDTSADAAAHLAERLRVCLADMTVPYLDLEIQLSASFGVATLRPASDSWDDLLSRVDAALYEAKRSGRNRVAIA
jgi:diguanylate cyclase (GGDEF)-like protein